MIPQEIAALSESSGSFTQASPALLCRDVSFSFSFFKYQSRTPQKKPTQLESDNNTSTWFFPLGLRFLSDAEPRSCRAAPLARPGALGLMGSNEVGVLFFQHQGSLMERPGWGLARPFQLVEHMHHDAPLSFWHLNL